MNIQPRPATKSVRFMVLMSPQLRHQLAEVANRHDASINEVIRTACEHYLQVRETHHQAS